MVSFSSCYKESSTTHEPHSEVHKTQCNIINNVPNMKRCTQMCITSIYHYHNFNLYSYACLNKQILNLFLNKAREVANFILARRVLYMAASFGNDLSPAHFIDVRKTFSSYQSLHLNYMDTFILVSVTGLDIML